MLGEMVQSSVQTLQRNLKAKRSIVVGGERVEVNDASAQNQAAKVLSDLALGLIREGQAHRGSGHVKVVVNAQSAERETPAPIDITPTDAAEAS